MHLSKQVFQSQELQKYLSYEAHFFFKMFQIECTFQNLDTKLEKEIGFIDNCF